MDKVQNFDNVIIENLNGFAQKNDTLTAFVAFLAQYLIYLIPIFFVIAWFWPKIIDSAQKVEKIRKDLLYSFILGVIGWQGLSRIIALFWKRDRPFTDLIGTKELIFHRPTYSFPSDHALFLFTLAFTFFLLGYKKIGWWTVAIASIVSISRVMVAVHWPSDVFTGAIIGLSLAYIGKFYYKQIIKNIVNPFYWVAEQIKLV